MSSKLHLRLRKYIRKVDKKLLTGIDTKYLIHQIWISTNFWCCSFLSLPWLPLVLSQGIRIPVLAVRAGEEFTGTINRLTNSQIHQYFHTTLTIIIDIICTGYSFWNRLRNFLHKFTWIVLSVHKLKKLCKFW